MIPTAASFDLALHRLSNREQSIRYTRDTAPAAFDKMHLPNSCLVGTAIYLLLLSDGIK